MSFFNRFFISAFLLFGSFFFAMEDTFAAAPPAYFDAILPEDFSMGLFGVQHRGFFGEWYAVVRNLANDVSNTLTADVNLDRMFGISESSNGSELFVVYGENNSGTENYNMYLTKLDSSAVVQAGWPVLFHPGGGIGGFHGQTGFVKMVPDMSGGVYLITLAGAESGFGSLNAVIRHYDGSGVLSFGPVDLGEFNVDMISDGAGGVFVMSHIGRDRDFNIGYEHGIVEHYTSAGLDAAWASGAGQFVISDHVSSQKHGATLMEDGAGGGIILWVDDESGTARLIRGQRFLSTGLIAPNWTTAGDNLYGTAPMDFTMVRGASSGFGHYYATFSELGEIKTISFDEDGDPLWSCTQNLGSATFYTSIGNTDGTNPGVFVITDNNFALGQHYEQDTGNSTWAIGGEVVASGNDFAVKYPDFANSFFPFENKSTGIRSDVMGTGVDLVYEDEDPFFVLQTDIFSTSFDRSTFLAGPGGDCSAGGPTVPDLPTLDSATPGDGEVTLSFTAPVDDGGDAIIDYTIEYGETVGWPGNAAIFMDGINTLTNVTVTGLTNGTEYSFVVYAENGIGLGPASNELTATPMGVVGGGRRRSETITIQGPQIFLGRLQELFAALQSYVSSGVYGSAEGGESMSYQSEDGGASQRSFSDDEYLRSQIRPERENLLQLLDLIIQLRHLFAWMSPEDAELLRQPQALKRSFDRLFLTRYFHQMTGIEYLKRGPSKTYEFDYRDPIHEPTRIVTDYQKSILLSFGKACYGEEVLRYAEEIDFIGNPDWYKRYVFIMKPWMDVVLGKNDYVQWTGTKSIDVLESLYLFLFGYCLADEITS